MNLTLTELQHQDPEAIDRLVTNYLLSPIDLTTPDGKTHLHHRAQLVTTLRTEKLWPPQIRGKL